METALITGATSGIGYELAKLFSNEGYNLVLIGRDKEKLIEIKKEFSQHKNKIITLQKDLSKLETPNQIYSSLKKQKIEIDILVNNAGFGDSGVFHECDLKKNLDMISVNIVALTHLTRLFLPAMVRKKHGRILNVSSMAAFIPGPKRVVYYATKSYVLSFSESLYNELKGKGISVTVLCPGATKTKFFERANLKKTNVLAKNMMDARRVALAGYKGMMKKNFLVIPGFKNRISFFLIRILPRSFFSWITRKAVEDE